MNCTYQYLDDLIYKKDLDFEKIILGKVCFEDIFHYYIRYKVPFNLKPSRIILWNINRCIKDYNGKKHLTLSLAYEKIRIF